MNVKPDCIICIMNQSLKVTKLLELDDEKSKLLLDRTAKLLIEHDLNHTPPQIAKQTYGINDFSTFEKELKEAKELVFIVKCNVVAQAIGQKEQELIFKRA